MLIGSWAILRGLFEIVAAIRLIRLRQELSDDWLLVLNGVASIAFGGLVPAFPRASALSLVWLMSVYLLAMGIPFLSLAVRLRNDRRPVEQSSARLQPGGARAAPNRESSVIVGALFGVVS